VVSSKNTHKRVNQRPPKIEVRNHCEYCHRDGHLEESCFRRKKKEQREYHLNNQNMYRLPMAYMYHLFRGVMLSQEVQCLKVLGLIL